jgi:hypothetical protein
MSKNIQKIKGFVCSKCVHGTHDIDAFGPETIECGRIRSEQLFMPSDGSCEHGRWFVKRQSQGRDMAFDTADDFIDAWYHGKALWYKRPDQAEKETEK